MARGNGGSPTDGSSVARLVATLRWAGRLVRQHSTADGGVDRRELADGLGAALVALHGSPLLVPERDGTPIWAVEMGGRRVVWAFSDEEAYEAWRQRRPHEATAGWTLTRVGGGPRDLGTALQRAQATHLAVNPAGPGWSRWDVVSYRRGRGRRLLRTPAPPAPEPIDDPACRGPMRQAVVDAAARARAAVTAGDEAEFHTAVGVIREMDDRHAEVAMAELWARRALDGPEPVGAQINGLLHVATWWAELGESAAAAAVLAELGRRTIAALDAGHPNPWLRQAVALAAGSLPRFGLPEWQADADAALQAVVRYPRTS